MNVFALSLLLIASFSLQIILMCALRRLPPIERLLHPLVWAAWTILIWLVAESDPNQGLVTLLVGITGGIGALIGLWREVGALCAWLFRFGKSEPQTVTRSLGPPIFSVSYDASGRPVTRGTHSQRRGIRV